MRTSRRILSGALLVGSALIFTAAAPAQNTPARQHTQEAPAASATSNDEVQSLDPELSKALAQMRQEQLREVVLQMRTGNRSSVLNEIANDIWPFLTFLILVGASLWVLRTVLENRRWKNMLAVQTETHAKLLEKFGSSADMLAYMESEAGRRFLEPPAFEAAHRQGMGFPYGRILWSVQAGIILALLGAGLMFLRGRVSVDADAPLLVFGTLGLTIGIGFLLSAGVSYAMSKSFGLLDPPKDAVSRRG